ncbi:hypothetical protein [Noviherbaspirillum sp. Root189]|uniref:hypothetical protein n=1 Tax=Noviherbaspirillum sp. Root189 TaxID=1736487 RepID=UPI00071118F2|nr:hypothetical protein [Noviherbaspirillum sp. Root189]
MIAQHHRRVAAKPVDEPPLLARRQGKPFIGMVTKLVMETQRMQAARSRRTCHSSLLIASPASLPPWYVKLDAIMDHHNEKRPAMPGS